jgi:hypothetical protein
VRVSTTQSPDRGPQARSTQRLRDLTPHDRDSVYYLPRGADWLWLGLFAAVLLGTCAWIWSQMGGESALGREIFFAAVLLSILWAAVIYTFKLSVSITVGPRGMSLVRGPWRTELTWAEVARMLERGKTSGGQHMRWVVAQAYDGRELRIREDMVTDYSRFRLEVYERHRLWQDHGGTWGTTGGGPFSATDDVANLVTWWLIGGGFCLLPGLYFLLLIPDTFYPGASLVALGALCALMALRARLGRQTYAVDRRAVVMHRPLRVVTLSWSEVARVDRIRSPFRLLARLGILLGQGLLALAARADGRVESFSWSPRVPEYLMLRGGGRRVRVRLHRLARPDELLAWIEFYAQVAKEAREHPLAPVPQAAAPISETETPNLAGPVGPADPWAGRRGGQPSVAATPPVRQTPAPDVAEAPTLANQPATPGPRVTKRILGDDLDPGAVDPRILAVIADAEASENRTPRREPTLAPAQRDKRGEHVERGGESDWLNETVMGSPFRRPPPPAAPSEEATLQLPTAAPPSPVPPYNFAAPPPPTPRPEAPPAAAQQPPATPRPPRAPGRPAGSPPRLEPAPPLPDQGGEQRSERPGGRRTGQLGGNERDGW